MNRRLRAGLIASVLYLLLGANDGTAAERLHLLIPAGPGGGLDSTARAIGEALRQNGRVIVTGCLGAEPDYITGAHPSVLAVTGPHQYEQVLDAVHSAVPPAPDPFIDLLPAQAVTLTPRAVDLDGQALGGDA